MRIEIRELQDADIEILAQMEAEAFSMPWTAQDFRGLLERSYCFYLVALAMNRPNDNMRSLAMAQFVYKASKILPI